MLVLRVWLLMVAGMMVLNAHTATAYLLSEGIKPIPFYFLALIASLWFTYVWDVRVVIACCSMIVVGTFLRGCEVLLYADQFALPPRLTGTSLWWFISGTTLAFGILNLIAVSRKQAEEWVWRERSSPSRL